MSLRNESGHAPRVLACQVRSKCRSGPYGAAYADRSWMACRNGVGVRVAKARSGGRGSRGAGRMAPILRHGDRNRRAGDFNRVPRAPQNLAETSWRRMAATNALSSFAGSVEVQFSNDHQTNIRVVFQIDIDGRLVDQVHPGGVPLPVLLVRGDGGQSISSVGRLYRASSLVHGPNIPSLPADRKWR